MIDHVSIQCNDVAASAAFYDAVLAPVGGKRILDFGEVIGYGVERPTFWIGPSTTGGQAKEVHRAFGAFVRDPDGNNVEAVCHTPG